MTRATLAGLTNAIRHRYGIAASKDKRRILVEFMAAMGYHEKRATRVLNSVAPKPRQTRQRTSLYDAAARAAPEALQIACVASD